MASHEHLTVTGRITDVFAHRFVVDIGDRRILADLTPKGAERIVLSVGDSVTLSGEQKPSELKVESIRKDGAERIWSDREAHHHDDDADPTRAVTAAKKLGFSVLGMPRRKPRHFEVLARASDGRLYELHVELDGRLRKQKDADPSKWGAEAAA